VKTAEQHLQAGLAHHRAGRGDAAAECYRHVLALDGHHADAQHLLGVVALQAEQWNEASALIEAAIAINDTAPPFHDHLAVVRRGQGRLIEAEASHRQALALDPKFASAHNNLATTLRDAGRLADAVASAKRAHAAAPDDPVICVNAGAILMAAKDYSAAADMFEVAVAAHPDAAEMHEKHAIALFQAGRMGRAETAFRRLLELAPEHVNGRRWLLETLLMLERLEEAVTQAEALAAAYPDDVHLQALLGVANWRAGRVDAAEKAFLRGLELDDSNLPAITGLAILQSSRGDVAAAARSYRRALDIDPDNADAYGNLATLGGDGLVNADAEHLAELLQRKTLPDDQRATVAFALAHYLNRVGEATAAFDWFDTGNLLRRAHLRGLGQVFNAALHKTFIDARIRVFTPGFFRARQGFGAPSQRPVFIIGLPRTGTTLVEQILASHPDVHGAGELRDMAVIALEQAPDLTGGEKPYPDCASDLSMTVVTELAMRYLTRLEALAGGGAARVIDKMPFNYLHLGLIHLLFPNARIIHCRRDPRDTGLSCFTTNFTDAHPWTTDLLDIGHYINAYKTLMAHWREVLPDAVFTEIDYENLVADQETESRRLVDFLGLDWNDDCLRFHEADRVVLTASRAQVRKPIYATSIARWKTHATSLKPMIDILRSGGGAL
jgi:tetratricopeptide (TPR) repeat protein